MIGTEARGDAESQSSQKILAIHRYYWPDTPPYATMLKRIVGQWVGDGHSVEVLSSQPSYKANLTNKKRAKCENLDGAVVRRLSLPSEAGRPLVRVVNALRLALGILWYSVRNRYDVIMVSTAPPVVAGVAAAVAAKLTGARFIYHCMDIHPEVGSVSGEFARPWVFKLLRKLDTFSCRCANPVVVLSADMAATLKARPQSDRNRIEQLNNFNLPSSEEKPTSLPFTVDSNKLTVLFAGNVGRFQGLDTVVEAMTRLADNPNIEFIIMGEGTAKATLKQAAEASGAHITFVDHQPVSVAKKAMQQVSYGYVSLVADMYRYAYPSKTMTYLAQGCPLIVAVEKDSELAQEAVEQQYGHWVKQNDGRALAELLLRLEEKSAQQQVMAANAAEKAKSDFSEAVLLSKWSTLLRPENEEVHS